MNSLATINGRDEEPKVSSQVLKSHLRGPQPKRDYVLREIKKPCSLVKTIARVQTLLSHYFVPNMDAAVQAAALEDWTDVLSSLPQFAVDEACRKWMASESRRPTPADISQRAVAIVSGIRTEAEELLAIPEPQSSSQSDEAKARMAQMVKGLTTGAGT